MIDFQTSRRDMFLRCEFWNQNVDEDYVQNNEIAYNRLPDGHFMAKEVGNITLSSNIIGEQMTPQNSLTVKTRDNISKLRENDLVRINRKCYRVESIQIDPIKKQRQFKTNNISSSYYITLRG